MSQVLGLDIGGSSTRARLVTGGMVTAEAAAGGASITAAGPDHAAAALGDLLGQLPDLTASLDAICAGAGGASTAAHTGDFLRTRLAPLAKSTNTPIIVVDDVCLILPAAGFTDGIAVIAGTGSIAAATWQGRTERVGGWGYLLGDEGSGYWIAREAVRELLARADRGEPAGPLGDCLFAATGTADPVALRAALYREPAPRRWAGLAPAILDCDDPWAERLTGNAAAALTGLVVLLASRLRVPDDLPVVLAGGLMHHEAFRAAAMKEMSTALPAAPVLPLDTPPVAGAVRLALAAAGVSVTGPAPAG